MTLLGRLRQWSLRRRLIVGTAALVLVTLLFAGAATVLSLRASLYERLDEDVLTGLDIARGPAGTAPDAGVPEGRVPGSGSARSRSSSRRMGRRPALPTWAGTAESPR